MIPKILFQTSYNPIEPYVTEKLKKYISDEWTYLHFNDEGAKEFFREHPLIEFPNIEKVFDGFMGPHRADLFRYYFLYIKGGVFVDSDAMLRCSLDDVVADCDLFYVKAQDRPSVFNGFIGCIPGHQVMYDALVDAYNINPENLVSKSNYHLLCNNLYQIVKNHPLSITKTLYEDGGTSEYSLTRDDSKNSILFHYHYPPKIIPKDLI